MAISRHWRLSYYRPPSIGFAGVALMVIGLVATTASPFLLAFQQMHGGISFLPGIRPVIATGLMAGSSGTLCLLAFFILRGKNWARWGYLMFGAAVSGFVFVYFGSPWEAVVAVAYSVFALLLFLPSVHEFFHLEDN